MKVEALIEQLPRYNSLPFINKVLQGVPFQNLQNKLPPASLDTFWLYQQLTWGQRCTVSNWSQMKYHVHYTTIQSQARHMFHCIFLQCKTIQVGNVSTNVLQ